MARNTGAIIAQCVLALLAGCTIVDSSSIPVGQRLPPIGPAQVKIYNTPPAHYDEIAIVSAKAGHDFKSDQSVMASAIQTLKAEAAAMGANGILLQNVHTRSEPTVTATFGTANAHGTGGSAIATGSSYGISAGDRFSKVSGLAIYVHEDRPNAPAQLVGPRTATAPPSAGTLAKCQAIQDEIFYAPTNNPSMSEDEKARLRLQWREMGCSQVEAGAESNASANQNSEGIAGEPLSTPAGSDVAPRLDFDQCFKKCKELTGRSPEQCFDACK